jgi:hypothetical protein
MDSAGRSHCAIFSAVRAIFDIKNKTKKLLIYLQGYVIIFYSMISLKGRITSDLSFMYGGKRF